MRNRHKPFTLVEVLLALGVCAIGICSIMVLFPVGASASRDAAARTYVANFADELLHFKQYEILTMDGGHWEELVKSGGSNAIAKPASVIDFCKDRANLFRSEPSDKLPAAIRAVVQDSGLWTEVTEIPGVYVMNSHPEVFQIGAKRGKNGDYWKNTDFCCIAVLWQEDLPGISNSFATRLKLEVSWPAELPYNQRQKSIFTLELFNNKG